MKSIIITLTMLVFTINCNAQSTANLLLKEAETWAYNQVEAESIITKDANYTKNGCNIKTTLLPSNNFDPVKGFIGSNYQRMRFRITNVVQNPTKKHVYQVAGKSLVKNNLVAFKGSIIVESFATVLKGETESYMAVVKYKLTEDVKQKSAGVFEGYGVLNFKCSNGLAIYNEDEQDADGFYNNQFVGTWTSNATKAVKPCNWGDLRIPNAGDLDEGAGEFMPNYKYLKYGWQGFYNAVINLSEADIANEEKKWWEANK
jgi:hypothetical protein